MLFSKEQLACAVPDTGWRPPSTFPRLDAAKRISVDLETKDPNLIEKGPGEIRNDGRVCGVGVGVDTGERWYFPIRHEFGSGNMNPEAVLAWCRDELTRPNQEKVGANLMYDVSWLRREGVEVKGKLIDVQYAQAILDENARSYALGKLANIWLNENKVDDALYTWLAATYGGAATRRAQGGRIHMAPASLVGPYCEGDVDLPLRIFELQEKELEAQGLTELFDMECRLTPLLLDMRWHGVRVDVERADEVRNIINKKTRDAQNLLNDLAGRQVDAYAAASIAPVFDKLGITYPLTPGGAPSFTKPWLEGHDSDIANAITTVRKYDKAVSTFIDSYIFGNLVGDRIHTQFHPLRGDENGTVSGRFSSSNPNLQNLPSRDPELGPLIRSLFIPDEGHKQWRRYDYSQVEYRLLAHYAIGEGAEDARQKYRDNPKTDYHQATREQIHAITGIMLDRKPTKNINFGLCYGMAPPTLAQSLGMSVKEATPLFNAYHEGVPFVKSTYERAMNVAQERGYIKTVLGRHRRFDYWEPAKWQGKDNKQKALPKDEAIKEYGDNIKRAGTHAALNQLLQGGSADIIKKAMVTAYESGIFDVIGVPLVTVHDELDHSDDGSAAATEAFYDLQNTMQDCVKLHVPLLADCEVGPNWGSLVELDPS